MTRRSEETAKRAEAMMKIERLAGHPDKIQESDLEIVIRSLKDAYLSCRDRHHAFPVDDDDPEIIWYTTRSGQHRRDQVCERCTMIKHELIRWDGTVYSRWYTAPVGYYLVGQKDRRVGLKVQLVRREVLRRKFGEAKITPIAELKKQRTKQQRAAQQRGASK